MMTIAMNFEIRLLILNTSVKKTISTFCINPVMIIEELYFRSRPRKLRFVLAGLSRQVQKLLSKKLFIIEISVAITPARI